LDIRKCTPLVERTKFSANHPFDELQVIIIQNRFTNASRNEIQLYGIDIHPRLAYSIHFFFFFEKMK